MPASRRSTTCRTFRVPVRSYPRSAREFPPWQPVRGRALTVATPCTKSRRPSRPRPPAASGKKSPTVRDEYVVSEGQNPHVLRARELIKRHPNVRELFGPYRLSAVCVAAVVTFQLL